MIPQENTPSGNSLQLLPIHRIKELPVFNDYNPEDQSWQPAFIEMIVLLDDFLLQSEKGGKRIDFCDQVGVNGKVQDITSLVNWMRQSMATSVPASKAQLIENRLNRYKDAGVGYFANGAFFSCDHEGEVAFFLDDKRIYLNRHIRRAIQEMEESNASSLTERRPS